jgi:hypothetical protein
MNVLERFLISQSERHLQKYRGAQGRLRSDFLEQYHAYLPEIERQYARAGYWHGTGRYQYGRAREARDTKVDTHTVVNVLESIVDAGGLEARHQERWVTYNGKDVETVSVAPTRMHARLYSHIHLREGVWLEYVFGGTRFWVGFFVFLGILALSKKSNPERRAEIKLSLLITHMLAYGRTWAGAVCNLDKYIILPIWRIYDLRSDIEGNHGVLFGIKHEAIRGDGVFTLVKNLEVRIDRPLGLNDMTHVEVPLEHVEETKLLLEQKNISLPVIPLEFGELYCSQFPLTHLVHV